MAGGEGEGEGEEGEEGERRRVEAPSWRARQSSGNRGWGRTDMTMESCVDRNPTGDSSTGEEGEEEGAAPQTTRPLATPVPLRPPPPPKRRVPREEGEAEGERERGSQAREKMGKGMSSLDGFLREAWWAAQVEYVGGAWEENEVVAAVVDSLPSASPAEDEEDIAKEDDDSGSACQSGSRARLPMCHCMRGTVITLSASRWRSWKRPSLRRGAGCAALV